MSVHEEFVAAIRLTYPMAEIDVHAFPSGAAVVDIRCGGRFITVECSATGGIGMSLLRGAEDRLSGHDVVVARLEDATNQVDLWLSSSCS
jgi:hypothetical protein